MNKVLPEGWREAKLGDIFELSAGGDIVEIIREQQIGDWWMNKNIRNDVINKIYDYLYAISNDVKLIEKVGEMSWTLVVENKEIL